MRGRLNLAVAATFVALVGCGDQGPAETLEPFSLTSEAVGRYCGMNVLEHSGPKGQIMLGKIPEPIWFSSARDTIAFTLLPEEPKNISAIYVSDMAKAPSWDEPGADNWIDARAAFYVIGSSATGGMGGAETAPFSTRAAAEDFTKANGGTVVTFDDIPPDYVLGSGPSPAPEDALEGAGATQ